MGNKKYFDDSHVKRAEYMRLYYKTHEISEDCKAKKRTNDKERERKQRIEAFEHYGGQRCSCCGETRYEFLAFDHINGNGRKHRKETRNMRIALWLKQNNYPAGFRVLCHNCNMAKGRYGYCPHEREKEESHA